MNSTKNTTFYQRSKVTTLIYIENFGTRTKTVSR
jgi:hypothetical protein